VADRKDAIYPRYYLPLMAIMFFALGWLNAGHPPGVPSFIAGLVLLVLWPVVNTAFKRIERLEERQTIDEE
jgi:hypothetical protein